MAATMRAVALADIFNAFFMVIPLLFLMINYECMHREYAIKQVYAISLKSVATRLTQHAG